MPELNNDAMNWDGFANIMNPVTGLGTPSDSLGYNEPILDRYFFNRERADIIHEVFWQAAKVCDYHPIMMRLAWLIVTLGDGDPNIISHANKAMKKLAPLYEKGQALANLYGGCFVIRLVDDGQPYDQPINYKKINSVQYSQLFDPWTVMPDAFEIIRNPLEPDYYIFYSVYGTGNTEYDKSNKNNLTFGYKIHKSRVLRFRGKFRSPMEQRWNRGLEASALTSFYSPMIRYVSSLGYTGEALRTFEVMALSITALMSKTQTQEGAAQMRKRLELTQQSLSAFKFFALDKGTEELQILGRKFNGVSDIIESLKDEMIGASGLTKPQFYQEHPAGLAATGESERLAEATSIMSLCEQKWGEQINDDLFLYFSSKDSITKGIVPDDWGIQWNSLYTETPTEKTTIRYQTAQTDDLNIKNGIYTNLEARHSHFGGADFDINITLDKTTDLDNLKSQPQAQPEQPIPGTTINQDPSTNNKVQDKLPLDKVDGLYRKVAQLSGIQQERIDSLTIKEIDLLLAS